LVGLISEPVGIRIEGISPDASILLLGDLRTPSSLSNFARAAKTAVQKSGHKIMNNIAEGVVELFRAVARALWCVASSARAPSITSPRVIFPNLRSGEERVSEQEVRAIILCELNKTPYHCAVEVPTKNTYRFTGSTGLSARTDVGLWGFADTEFRQIANIECKAHNPPEESIKKDIEKLIREEIVGGWFHLLRNANLGTFKSLFNKFASAIEDRIAATKDHPIRESKIVFCFCVLDRKLYLLKRFDSIYRAQQSMCEARELCDNGKSLDDVLRDLATIKNWEIVCEDQQAQVA
jgi:hypothetical protein